MKGRERNSKFFEQQGIMATNRGTGPASGPAGCGVSKANKNYLRAARESGSANLSNRNLVDFPIDLCYYEDKIDLDEKYWETLPLVKIDLSYNKVSSIPPDIARLTDLTTLRLRNNTLTVIAKGGLSQCTNLRSLDLSSNALPSLDEVFGNMIELKELLLGSNDLSSLPRDIANLRSLQILDAQDNKITSIPEHVHRLQALLKLNLNQNMILELPASISELRLLQSMEIKRNCLRTLPDLSNLVSLTYLDASENQLESFPRLPLVSSVLARLYLGNNRLTKIDCHALQPLASCLTELQLHDNAISVIPLEIGNLAGCRVLDLSNNNLSDIPHTLGYMGGLQKLVVDGNPIRCIRRTLLTQSTMDLKKYLRTRGEPLPSQISTSLQHNPNLAVVDAMDMGSNRIDEMTLFIDEQIRNITNGSLNLSHWKAVAEEQVLPCSLVLNRLQKSHMAVLELDISHNKLRELPQQLLLQMQGLRSLQIHDNHLSDSSLLSIDVRRQSLTPPALLPLSLKQLVVSHNKLTDQHLEALLWLLEELVDMDVSGNALTRIPDLSRCSSTLRSISLANNRIASVAGAFPAGRFPVLEVVDLSNNQIQDISPLLSLPQSITSISLDNNNVKEIPAELALLENLKHVGLYGNPQKAIRTNMLGNTNLILQQLRNKLPAQLSSHNTSTNTGIASTIMNVSGNGNGNGNGNGMQKECRQFDYYDASEREEGNSIATAWSHAFDHNNNNNSSSINNNRRQQSAVNQPPQPPMLHQYQPHAHVQPAALVAPGAPPAVQRVGTNHRLISSAAHTNGLIRGQAFPTTSSTSTSTLGSSYSSMEMQKLQQELLAIERELSDNISITTSRKTLLQKQVAVKKANIFRLNNQLF